LTISKIVIIAVLLSNEESLLNSPFLSQHSTKLKSYHSAIYEDVNHTSCLRR